MTRLTIGQGDVTIIRVGDAEKTRKKKTDVTLAVGEESGHSHVLKGAVEIARDGKRFLSVPQDTQVVVAGMPWRHDPLDVPAGLYEVIDHQIEYTPAAIVRSMD